MESGLEGKRALVLGGTRGLGLAIAQAFAAGGARVILCGRNAEKADAAARAIGKGVQGLPCNTGDIASVDALWQHIKRNGGGLDILVLNSGGPPSGPARGVVSEEWRRHFESMFVGPVRLADHVLPGMIKQRYGRIIAIASSGVVQPIPNLGMSNAIRPALVGWCKTLSNEVAEDGITVNVLLPGRVQTQRVDEIDAANARRLAKNIDIVRDEARRLIPAGRYGRPEEFAAAAVFLAGSGASYITGSLLRVDGGLIAAV